MSTSSREKISAELGFEELTEAVSTALLRAIDARPAGEKGRVKRITAGIWVEPDGNGDKLPSRPECVEGGSLSSYELKQLGTGEAISRTSVAKLNDRFEQSPELAQKLIVSLSRSFSATLSELFELTEDELAATRIAETEDQELLAELPNVLHGGRSLESFTIDVVPVEQGATAKRKPEFTITAKCEGGQTDEKGNWKCGGGVGIKF